jgi:hypothetical protein
MDQLTYSNLREVFISDFLREVGEKITNPILKELGEEID